MGDYTHLNIVNAHFNTLPQSCISIFGRRRTGKTHWAMFMVTKLSKHIDRFIVFCGNKDNMVEWEKVLHPIFIHGKNLKILADVKRYQENKVSRSRKQWTKSGRDVDDFVVPRKLRLCVVLDDCGSDRAFMHSKLVKEMSTDGRHYGIDLLLVGQYINQLHSEVRDQLDYIALLKTRNQTNLEKIYKEYISSSILPKHQWTYVLSACTRKKGWMCWIDNSGEELQDTVFHARLKPWPFPWRQVSPFEIRNFAKRHYLPVKNDETEESDGEGEMFSEDDEDSDRSYEHPPDHHRSHRHRREKESVISLKRRFDKNQLRASSLVNRERFYDQRGKVLDICRVTLPKDKDKREKVKRE